MLEKIYEVIADKTLSFGCKVQWYSNDINYYKDYVVWTWIENYFEHTICNETITFQVCDMWREETHNKFPIYYIEKIIWHPVMIWDVLDLIHKLYEEDVKRDEYMAEEYNERITIHLLNIWKDKRKPIDHQTDECIDFIYSLIKDGE